jgi:hypothetical protein
MAGNSDCNKGTAPNTDGCECATPGCCSSSCETTHSDGVGQSYYDCNPLGTYSSVTAIEACTAYANSVGGSAANCSDGWTCTGDTIADVCYGNTAGTVCSTYCWGYAGAEASFVYTCACPDAKAGVSWE